ncbi:MAG TPA: LacI family DNA-binding transcriptional regulator [Clostridia bacterium]|nr:LacI family DNA-binding transcriptional regulator [Clostridia bacterium]
MVTIYDIAKMVGCAPSTVSKAFNNYNGVNKKTYQKIMETAESLGYTMNNSARALATKKTWLIGVLFCEDAGTGIAHQHYSTILQGFRSRAGECGYDVVFLNKRFGNKEASFLEHCIYRGVDGVLIAVGAKYEHEIRDVLESDIKRVSVESMYKKTPLVVSDNKMGSMQALEYLYFLGHRKIAHIACPLWSVAGNERYEAYKEFLKLKGLEENPKYIVETGSYAFEEGSKAAAELIQRCWGDLPTAVYAGYDDIAWTAMTTFQAHGFRVPDDISIVGFDDVTVSAYTTPTMTTVSQDRIAIGQKAADVLIQSIENREMDAPAELRVPTKLIVRNSCVRIM